MGNQEALALLESSCNTLEAQLQCIEEEIRNYPRPIAVCDVQFNYLLDERMRIGSGLERMQEERQILLAAAAAARSQDADLRDANER